jgi:glycosyltransferase involved in cell wall biosynthesis
LPDAVLAATLDERDELASYGIEPDRIVVIPAGIGDEWFRPRLRAPRQALGRLIFVGRLSRDRRIEVLIEAVKYVRDRGREVRLRIVGVPLEGSVMQSSGYVAELLRLVRDLGLAGAVSFVGALVGDDLREEYARADAFVYAARYDNFGQAILEAAASALPIFTTSVGVARSLAADGAVVLLSDSAKELGQVLLSHFDQKSRLADLATLAQAAARRNYRWESIVGEYARLYRDLIDERRVT